MKTFYKYLFTLLALLFLFIYAETTKIPAQNNAEIFFFDVGQGDAEMIQKGDFQILIDGGPDDKILSEIGQIMPLTDHKIDVIILTHPHADHLRGINLILDRYSVGTIYGSAVLDTTDGYLEFLNKIKDKNISFKVPGIYEKIIPFANSELDFLWPGDKYKSTTLANLNNSSLVSKFCYYSKCIIFTGDIETEEITTMVDYYASRDLMPVFHADVLKISHHGSRNGASEDFFKAVAPNYAIIEVGSDNKYGHPHAELLELLKKLAIPVYRTDLDGTIKFDISENSITKSGS